MGFPPSHSLPHYPLQHGTYQTSPSDVRHAEDMEMETNPDDRATSVQADG